MIVWGLFLVGLALRLRFYDPLKGIQKKKILGMIALALAFSLFGFGYLED